MDVNVSTFTADAITAPSIATGALTDDAFAANALVAATFATDSFSADAMSAAAVTKINTGMATSVLVQQEGKPPAIHIG